MAAVIEAAGRLLAGGGVGHKAGEGAGGVILGGGFAVGVFGGGEGFGDGEGAREGGWWEVVRRGGGAGGAGVFVWHYVEGEVGGWRWCWEEMELERVRARDL